MESNLPSRAVFLNLCSVESFQVCLHIFANLKTLQIEPFSTFWVSVCYRTLLLKYVCRKQAHKRLRTTDLKVQNKNENPSYVLEHFKKGLEEEDRISNFKD